jgi:dTMP kinase
MEGRDNKFSGDSQLDIHESDFSYLEKSYENAKYVSKKFGWQHILCVENGVIRTIEDIQKEIISLTEKIL